MAIVGSAADEISFKDKMIAGAIFFFALWIWTKEGSMLAGSIFFLAVAAIIQWPGASAVVVLSIALLAGAAWVGWKALQVLMAMIVWTWRGLVAASRATYEFISIATQSITSFVLHQFAAIIVSLVVILVLYLVVRRFGLDDNQ